jgi:chromate transporter
VGFAVGILRAGWAGGLAAWVGFTLPSALLMLAFAYGHSMLDGRLGQQLVHGLQLVAVAVVAQAILAMQRSLAPDRVRMAFAIIATGITLLVPITSSSLLAIVLGGGCGGRTFPLAEGFCEITDPSAPVEGHRPGHGRDLSFASCAAAVSESYQPESWSGGLSAFYRSGALVFGGGHVVLPLLQNAVVARGWVTEPTFLAGYGAAQAMPGPLFSFAAYLGASVRPARSPLFFGVLGLIGIFLPGLVLMAAVLPFWSALRGNRLIQAALTGVNASVVGILIAALFQPLWTTTIHSSFDFWIALSAFALLTFGKVQPWIVVAGVAALSMLIS